MAKVIALYLPQFHPIEENNEWYGTGFTEWTNVAKSKPLFCGHKQPRIPADLGFYDLRLPETRYKQAEMAKKYGIDGFSFYHYWFGDGKQLLEKPFQDILQDEKYDFPFMLHWANGSWYKKMWKADGVGDELLIEQTYPSLKDAENHFYTLLPAFKDKRYMRLEGKIMFAVDLPLNSPQITEILQLWRKLAQKENIGEFFFIAHTAHHKERTVLSTNGVDALLGQDGLYSGAYDAIMDSQYREVMYRDFYAKVKYVIRKKLNIPNKYHYKDAIRHLIKDYDKDERVFPEVFPQFDHSPRSKGKEIIYTGSTPELFEEYMKKTLQVIKNKQPERQLVFIRAWNEWGEGNYLEPDLTTGLGYLEAIQKALHGVENENN